MAAGIMSASPEPAGRIAKADPKGPVSCTQYSVSQIQLSINRLIEALRLISSGATDCAPAFERETLQPQGDRRLGPPKTKRPQVWEKRPPCADLVAGEKVPTNLGERNMMFDRPFRQESETRRPMSTGEAEN